MLPILSISCAGRRKLSDCDLGGEGGVAMFSGGVIKMLPDETDDYRFMRK